MCPMNTPSVGVYFYFGAKYSGNWLSLRHVGSFSHHLNHFSHGRIFTMGRLVLGDMDIMLALCIAHKMLQDGNIFILGRVVAEGICRVLACSVGI
jgi:hypothetical protein